MYFYFILLILIQFPSINPTSCSYKPMTRSRLQMTSANSFRTVFSTSTSLRLKEKVCSEIIFESNPGTLLIATNPSDRRFLTIELTDVWQEYQIKRSYNFTTPTIDIQCQCRCPGGSLTCKKQFETNSQCPTSKKNLPSVYCFGKYSYGDASYGCFRSSEAADVCCSVAMYRDDTSVIYRAMYIDSPTTWYQYKIELLDGNDKVLESSTGSTQNSRVVTFGSNSEDKEDKTSFAGKNTFYLETTRNSVMKLLPSMWVYHNPKTKKIMINENVGLNLVDETNLHKFGWFKLDNNQNAVPVSPITARSALSVSVKNCANDVFWDDWNFDAVGWKKKYEDEHSRGQEGVWIKDFYASTVADVSYRESSYGIEVRPRNAEVSISLSLDFNTESLVDYGESRFEKFSGMISTDEFSNKILYLSVEMALGPITVRIGSKTSCTLQEMTINVVSLKPKGWQQMLMIDPCFVGKQVVCLHTLPKSRVFHCKMLEFREKFVMHQMIPPTSKIDENISYWSEIKSYKSEIYALCIIFIGFLIVLYCKNAACFNCNKPKRDVDINLATKREEKENLV